MSSKETLVAIEKPKQDLNKKILTKYIYGFIVYISIALLSVFLLAIGKGIYSPKSNFIYFIFLTAFIVVSAIVLIVLLINKEKKIIMLGLFEILDLTHFVMMVVSTVFFLQTFVFTLTEVYGTSMEPTLHEKDYVVVIQEPVIYYRDNIVVLRSTKYTNGQSKDYYVKRIKAVPGDKIHYLEVEDSFVIKVEIYINDEKLFEAPEQTKEMWKQWIDEVDGIIPKKKYLLIGDNIESFDSKMFGFVDKKDILGKVRFRIFKKFGAVKWFSGILAIWPKRKEKLKKS